MKNKALSVQPATLIFLSIRQNRQQHFTWLESVKAAARSVENDVKKIGRRSTWQNATDVDLQKTIHSIMLILYLYIVTCKKEPKINSHAKNPDLVSYIACC